MNQTVNYYGQYYFNFIATLITIFGLGHIICKVFQENITKFFYSFFAKLFIGLITFTLLISLYKTNFVSINLVFIILAISYCIYNRSNLTLNNILQKRNWTFRSIYLNRWKLLYSLIAASILFMPEFILLIKNGGFPFALTDLDSVYYSNVSQFMSLSGKENTYHVLNLLDPDYVGLKPYHYFELWLNAGITDIFGGLNLINYKLVTSSILYFMIYIGILAIWEKYNRITIIKLICSALILFLSGIVIKFYSNFDLLRFIDRFQTDIFSLTKLTLCYVFIIAFILSIVNNKKIEAFFILLCIPVASIVNAPALIGGIFLFLVINVYFKYLDKKELLTVFVLTIIVCASIIIIYALFPSNGFKSHLSFSDTAGDILGTINYENFKTQINIIIGTGINLFVLYFPYLLPLIILIYHYKIDKDLNLVLLISFCMLTSGLIMWALTFQLANAVQLFNNIASPLLNSLVILLFIITLETLTKHKKKLADVLLIYFMFLCCCNIVIKGEGELNKKVLRNVYSDKYLLEIKTLINNTQMNPIGAFIKEIDSKSGALNLWHSWNNDALPIVYNLGIYLNLIKNNYTTVSISNFEELLSQENFKQLSQITRVGIFYHFVEKQKVNSTYENIEKSQIDFVNNYSINYLIVTKEVTLSHSLQSKVIKTITDTTSGERFMLLENRDGN